MYKKSLFLLAIFILFANVCFAGGNHEVLKIEEVLVKGDPLTIGDGNRFEQYQAEIEDLYVACYEFSWEQFAFVANYGLTHKQLELRETALYPLVGINANHSSLILDIKKNAEYVSLSDGRIVVVNGAENQPVRNISWYGAALFCNILSEINNYKPCYNITDSAIWSIDEKADGYRLPSFDEWEYIAGGGQLSEGFTYAGSDDAEEVGWFVTNSGGKPHPVGMLKPNELGIYDLNGNVHEFCTEINKALLLKGAALTAENRIWRGGAYKSAIVDRYHFTQNPNFPDFLYPFDDVGFRTVRKQ